MMRKSAVTMYATGLVKYAASSRFMMTAAGECFLLSVSLIFAPPL